MKKALVAVLAVITVTAAAAVHTAAAKKITEEKAKAIAFKDAGISAEDAERVTVKLENDDGVLEYDVEFYIGNLEYDYEISAKNGKILSRSVEEEDEDTVKQTAVQKAKITEEEAKKIAFKDADVSEKDAERVTVKLEYDDGVLEYDVEFYIGNMEYDYEISAETGKILSKSVEEDDDRPAANTVKSPGITIDEAKKIALKKVPGAKDKNIKIKLDRDDGKTVYEGKIVYKDMEYEFEIDAESGRILEWESESIYEK